MDPIISQTLQKDQQLQAGNNLIGAGGLSPAAGATALQAGPKVGIPPDVAVYNPDPVKAQADLAEAQARVAASPHLTSFMAQAGPATVAAAQPHLEGLAAIGQKVQNFIDNTDSGVHEFLKGVPFGSDIENIGKAPVQAFKSADALLAQEHEAYSKGDYLKGLSLDVQSAFQNFAGLAGYTPVGAAYNLAARPVAEGLATATEAGVGALGGKTTPAQHAKDTADFEQAIGLGILAIKPGGAEPTAPEGKTGTGVVPVEPAPTGGEPAPVPNIDNPVTPSDFAAQAKVQEAEANRVFRSLPVRSEEGFAVGPGGVVQHGAGQPAIFSSPSIAQAWVDNVGNPNPTSSQVFDVVSNGDGTAHVVQVNYPNREVGQPAGENPASDAANKAVAELDQIHLADIQDTLAKSPELLRSPQLMADFVQHIGTKTIDIPGADHAQ